MIVQGIEKCLNQLFMGDIILFTMLKVHDS